MPDISFLLIATLFLVLAAEFVNGWKYYFNLDYYFPGLWGTGLFLFLAPALNPLKAYS